MSTFYPDRRTVDRFRWALVDATARDTLHASWPSRVVAPSFLGDDTDRCPALLDLHAMPAEDRVEWCDALHREALDRQDTRASMLLAANAEIGVVAAHLARRMVLNLPGQGRPMQWRFFDPGTFVQMKRVLGTEGMVWLMGPVSALMLPWMGEWTLIARPSAECSGAGTQPFLLDQGHLAALQRIGIINRVLMQDVSMRTVAAWIDQSQQLDPLVVRGQSHGLSQREDLVAYVQHAHAVHPRIHDHPRMKALLLQLKQASADDELDYRELTSAFEPQDWQAMAAELHNTSIQEETHP